MQKIVKKHSKLTAFACKHGQNIEKKSPKMKFSYHPKVQRVIYRNTGWLSFIVLLLPNFPDTQMPNNRQKLNSDKKSIFRKKVAVLIKNYRRIKITFFEKLAVKIWKFGHQKQKIGDFLIKNCCQIKIAFFGEIYWSKTACNKIDKQCRKKDRILVKKSELWSKKAWVKNRNFSEKRLNFKFWIKKCRRIKITIFGKICIKFRNFLSKTTVEKI